MTIALSVGSVSTSFAGQWKSNDRGWWYEEDNGPFYTNGWQWIDGNNDGIAECYHFNQDGYLDVGTFIEDDYWVNDDGQWEKDGIVQTKNVSTNNSSVTNNQSTSSPKISAPLDDYFGGFCYAQNSADGIKLYWSAKNNTGKTINYYTVYFNIFNPVGDVCYDQITHLPLFRQKYVGPVAPGGKLVCYNIIGYTSAPHTIVLSSIEVQYSDGTTEEIDYGYYTTKVNKSIL